MVHLGVERRTGRSVRTPADSITTSVEYHGEIVVLTVHGEVIDLATAPVLKQAIDDLLGQGVTELIIDLSAVTFLSSVGLMILVSTCDRLGDAAGFAVVATGPARRSIQLTAVDQVISLRSTLGEALESLRNR